MLNKKLNKDTKIYKMVKPVAATILSGKLLAIDPSTGSQSSMPGYAIYKRGQLIESGYIQINISQTKNRKLFQLVSTIREEFKQVDVLAIENIPPISFARKGAMSGWSLVALQRSIGAIVSCFDCDYVEVSPTLTGKYRPLDMGKSDEADAIGIGNCVIEYAKYIAEGDAK